jgi:ribosomal protein L37E
MELIPDFRCERCGYDLSFTAAEERCQECGTPVAESRPERRPGVSWQRRPMLVSWLRTNWDYALHPFRSFREARIESRAMRRLAITNMLVALVTSLGMYAASRALDRDLITFSSGGGSHIIVDGAPSMIAFMNVLCAIVFFPIFQWSATKWAPRAKPPRHGAVAWVSGGLTSGAFVLATAIASSVWLVRSLLTPPPDVVVPADPNIAGDPSFILWRFAFAAPSVLFLAIVVAYGAIDYFANRVNYLSNTLDPRP